jgi:hypothetical protein
MFEPIFKKVIWMPPSDTAFLVGADLVEFDRHDLPIYATPQSQWADAGRDVASFGAPLDRLFGEPGQVFVSGELTASPIAALPTTAIVDDPLVELSGLNDGLLVPAMEHEPAHDAGALHLPEIATVYDFADGLHLHDLWTFDSHA